MLYFIIIIFFIIVFLYIFCNLNFRQQLLQSSVSHDPSEIILIFWFAAQETFIIIVNVKNSSTA